ncbi:MAG: lipase family protein [Bacteroidales bacterium]
MIRNRYIIRFAPLMINAAVMFSSCGRDDKPVYGYYLSGESAGEYQEVEINGKLNVLARSYPEISELGTFISDGVSIYRITYTSVVKGKNITASGLVSVPMTPGEYPVISFQNDINTLNSNCPSENPTYYLYQLVEFVASMGFVVLIPDYPGFGSSSGIPHPYLLKVPTLESVIRMIQAVSEAENEFGGIKVKNECYLIGYSQGGLATFNAHTNLELGFSSYGLNLRGSACGAGPYELEQMMSDMRSAQSYPIPAHIGYIINAWTYYDYISNSINELLKEPYSSKLKQLYDGYHSIAEINSQLTTSMPDLFTDEFRNNSSPVDFASVGASLVWNSAYAYESKIPVLLVHGDADTEVNVSNTETLHNLMILHGTSPEMCKKMILPELDHGEALIPFMVEGLKFLMNLRDN